MANKYRSTSLGTGLWSDDTGTWVTTSGGSTPTTHPIAGDTAFLNASSGPVTVDVTSACAIVNCTGYTNTLALGADITTTSTVTFVTGMTFTPSTYTWHLSGSMTLTPAGKSFYNLDFAATGTYTLAAAVTVTNLLSVATASTATLSTSDITCQGGITITGTGIITGRTITLTGSGTWQHTGTGTLKSSLTINTSGTIVISGTVYYSTGTLTYIAGTVTTTSSTLTLNNSCTLATSGINWNNITTVTTGTCSLTSSLTILGNLIIGASTVISCDVNNVTLNGNFTNNRGTAGLLNNGNIFIFNGTSTVAGATNFYTIQINAGCTVTLTSTQTFTVTYSIGIAGTSGSNVTLNATSGGSRAILTLSGTIQNVAYCLATDIDSSASTTPPILNYYGTDSNTLGWRVCPQTFFMDYVNGNDGNSGANWANAKRTMDAFVSLPIYPGDTVKIAKSPDPTSLGITALWTDRSKTVALNSALTLTVELCNSGWTGGTGCTLTYPTADRKQGAADLKIATGAGVTGAQKLAYKGLGSTVDFSGYQQISFWVKILTGATIASGQIQICLCSDTLGATVVNTINVPAIPVLSTTQWIAFTVDYGSALSSSIQSVAIYCNASGYASSSIEFDDIIACKAPSSVDSLSLTSLIGKNTGDEGWFAIQSIDGTSVLLDDASATIATGGRGYSGTTETVTTYKRETIKTDIATVSTNSVFYPLIAGNSTYRIQWKGGYNTSSGNQDGETFFDGQNGWGYGIYMNQNGTTLIDYVDFSNISLVKYNDGYHVDNNNWYPNSLTFVGWQLSNNSGAGFNSNDAQSGATLTFKNINNNLSRGIQIRYANTGSISFVATVTNLNSNGAYGVYITGTFFVRLYITNLNNNVTAGLGQQEGCYDLYAEINYIKYNTSYGLWLANGTNQRFICKDISNNGAQGIYFRASIMIAIDADNITSNGQYGIVLDQNCNQLYVNNANIKLNVSGCVNCGSEGLFLNYCDMTGETVIVLFASSLPGYNLRVFSTAHNKDVNQNNTYYQDALIQSQQVTRRTPSGVAWQVSPIPDYWGNNYRNQYFPVKLPLAKIACNASALVTVSVYVRRDNTGITAKLVAPRGQLGLISDVVYTAIGAVGAWEQLTITFTPSFQGVIQIEAWVYGGTTYNAYFDDMTISQA